MKSLKYGVWGILGGLLYAFISFYLLTPVLRKNLIATLLYGFRGLIFGVAFYALSLVNNKITKKKNLKFIINMLIGAIAGFLSCIYDVVITYSNAIVKPSVSVPPELKAKIISELLHISIGFVLMGLIIGFLIGLFELRAEKLRDERTK